MNKSRETELRAGEAFHSLRVPPGDWTVFRLDGHGFSRLTREHYAKPFDEKFHVIMRQVAQDLLEEWHAIYAWTASDEISLLLPLGWDKFDREVEKCVSLLASRATATFVACSGLQASFDARVWAGGRAQVPAYFAWRQADAERCALNGYAYWLLRRKGLSATATTHQLQGQNGAELRALLRENDIAFDTSPLWQRRGIGLSWENWNKVGFNPLTQTSVTATRRRVQTWESLPTGKTYTQFVEGMLEQSLAS